MTYLGPTSFVSSSRFFLCSVKHAGGAFYHNGCETDSIILTDSLFTHNTADTVHNAYIDHYGGALKDLRSYKYSSLYSFTFFIGNIAEKNIGHDIAIGYNPLSEGNLIHCFTTTSINAFSNAGNIETNWLPLSNKRYKTTQSMKSAHSH